MSPEPEPDRQGNVCAAVSCRQGTTTSDAIEAAGSAFLALPYTASFVIGVGVNRKDRVPIVDLGEFFQLRSDSGSPKPFEGS